MILVCFWNLKFATRWPVMASELQIQHTRPRQSCLDDWKESAMRFGIEIKFRFWGWRLRVELSRR